MGKLDAECMRHLSKEDFRVLTAVEMGMKNHDVVPLEIIVNIAKLRHGGAHRFISNLHRFKLIYHDAKKYDGYRLTYQGYDILALHTFVQRGHVVELGRKIGVGKESDVYLARNAEGEEVVLKFARLGRTSFRSIKRNRDYLVNRKSASWLYMSRLAALKEYAFMKVLYEHGFPTPVPVDANRHVVVMSRVDGFPMSQVRSGQMDDPHAILGKCLDVLVKLFQHGLIHCDFNEFNLMVSRTGDVTLIDFPQMVSTEHENAAMYFDRDVSGLVKYFKMKMKISVPEEEVPTYKTMGCLQQESMKAAAAAVAATASSSSTAELNHIESETDRKEHVPATETSNIGEVASVSGAVVRLDDLVRASGFSAAQDREITQFLEMSREEEREGSHGNELDDDDVDDDDDDEEEEDNEEEEDEEDDASKILIRTSGCGAADDVNPAGGDGNGKTKTAAAQEGGDAVTEANEQMSFFMKRFVNPLNGLDEKEENDELSGDGSYDSDDWMAAQSARGASHAASLTSVRTDSSRTGGPHYHSRRKPGSRKDAKGPQAGKAEGRRNASKQTFRGKKVHKMKI